VYHAKRRDGGAELIFKCAPGTDDHNDLKAMNDPADAEVENLVNLVNLHEPGILFVLGSRYINGNIYTYTGPILIALNPFKSLPIYSSQTLETYYNYGLVKEQGLMNEMVVAAISPHVFAIADAAYRAMVKAISNDFGSVASTKGNQAVLISGESGAGKTESTKLILRYLTTVSAESHELKESGSVMDKVLQSNPILEAFGNARTVRNDNSSRFGKYIDLRFNRTGLLIGGSITTYLLEKVRLCGQQLGERNYHVFYQMCAGGSADEMKRWNLTKIQDYAYCNGGQIFKLERIDDQKEFADTRSSMETLNFDDLYQKQLFDTMAGLLHFGNIKFDPDADGEGSVIAKDPLSSKSMADMCRLTGLPLPNLTQSCTVKVSYASSEKFQKKLTASQASEARDALTKAIYARLFDWIVEQINAQLKAPNESHCRADIGVLDIFGFEIFKINSFEQLCINYTNETLQQQFNKYVFELEQIEYKEEGIEWSFISFPSNQDCLDLIEMKKKGIFAMIDDECVIPKGSDANLASRMYAALAQTPRFSANTNHRNNCQFQIAHYAGEVVYTTYTFCDKNKDELPKEAQVMFANSTVPLLAMAFSGSSAGTKAAAGRAGPKPSVCFQFKESLTALMQKISLTKPHYIRTIKPNDQHKPEMINKIRTTEQLSCGGVLEAVKVARSGFPYRFSHQEFYSRYRPLANPFNTTAQKLPRGIPPAAGDAGSKFCTALMAALWDDASRPAPTTDPAVAKVNKHSLDDMVVWKGKVSAAGVAKEQVQIGKTKVFMRTPPYNLLEGRRARLQYLMIIKIQSQARCKKCMKILKKLKEEERKKKERLQKGIAVPPATPAAVEEVTLAMNSAAVESSYLPKEEAPAYEEDEVAARPLNLRAFVKYSDPVEMPDPATTKALRLLPDNTLVFNPRFRFSQVPMRGGIREQAVDGDDDSVETIYSENIADKLSDVDLNKLFHKKADQKAKEAYRMQFPTKWNTSTVMSLFGINNG
jgi:myosin-5